MTSSAKSAQLEHRAIFDEFIFNHLPRHLLFIEKSEGSDSPTIKIVSGSAISSLFADELRRIDNRVQWSSQGKNLKKAIHAELKALLKYAIFSHRWYAEGEPSFQEISSNSWGSGKGFDKLREFCKKALETGCQLAWSDTCCIDKSSSAELDEAIRSMFRWYRHAYICIVHLNGVLDWNSELERDEWFVRGWTLQELLAPTRMKFYGKNWNAISSQEDDKENQDLMQDISKITKIDRSDLESFEPGTKDIRQRMSWASRRQTTRIEDLAYCLIGIFDVNLPIAYGEGDWAFYRLMEVIIQRCDEWGIFAWAGPPSHHGKTRAIAQSPHCYQELSDFPSEPRTKVYGDTSFVLSRRGLRLRLMIAIGDIRTMDKPNFYQFSVSHTPDFTPVEVHVSTEELKIEEDEWAIGIVNYLATDEPEEEVGKLEGEKDYVCFLLRRLRGSQDESTRATESREVIGTSGETDDRAWRKQPTDNILVVRTCFQTDLASREPVKGLWL